MTCATRQEQLIVPRRQARTLVKNGYDVYFCVSDDGPVETIDGVKYIPVGYHGGGYVKRILLLSRLMYKVALDINADYYQTESPDFLKLLLRFKRKGKKCFYTFFESHPFTYYNKSTLPYFLTHIGVLLMSYSMKRKLKYMDAVFAVSDDILDYLNKWGIKKAVLLGNFPEVNKDYQLTKEDYLNRENRVIYYGHIPNSSRQQNVISAIKDIPNVKYLLAGKFWDYNVLNRLKEDIGENRIEFIDGFERNRLPEILSKCTISNTARDLSGTKSSNGSFGIIKIFESMEAALPILCQDVPMYRKLINEYHCGMLVDVNNIDSIRNAMQYLVSHKEEAYEMGQNGRRAVIEKYSWDQVQKIYLSYL